MLNRVTLTGVDNRTCVTDLIELNQKYPFVEFGVLISKNNSNKNTVNRYPNLTILKRLKNQGLNLSCHICGSIARDIVQRNDWRGVKNLLGKDFDIFQRFQLNVSNVHIFVDNISFPKDKQFIIQINDNTSLYDCYKDNSDVNVVGFLDKSGGKGIVSEGWIIADRYFGFAGGIGPDNVISVVEDLLILNDYDFWIDMESSIRTNDWLDISKCQDVLDKCKSYILKEI